jgi:hypothetical protein
MPSEVMLATHQLWVRVRCFFDDFDSSLVIYLGYPNPNNQSRKRNLQNALVFCLVESRRWPLSGVCAYCDSLFLCRLPLVPILPLLHVFCHFHPISVSSHKATYSSKGISRVEILGSRFQGRCRGK